MNACVFSAALSLAFAGGPASFDDEKPPKLSSEAQKAGSDLKTALPRPRGATMASAKLSQAISSMPASVRGTRLKAADTLAEAYFLGKVVSTLKFYAGKNDAETVKARLATVRKMSDKAETIAMVDFLAQGAAPDVVGSTAYAGMLNDLTGVVQSELAGRKRSYAGLYRAGLVALYLPFEDPLSGPQLTKYATYFQMTNAQFGPYPGVIGAVMKELAKPNKEGMLKAIAWLDQELKA